MKLIAISLFSIIIVPFVVWWIIKDYNKLSKDQKDKMMMS